MTSECELLSLEQCRSGRAWWTTKASGMDFEDATGTGTRKLLVKMCRPNMNIISMLNRKIFES